MEGCNRGQLGPLFVKVDVCTGGEITNSSFRRQALFTPRGPCRLGAMYYHLSPTQTPSLRLGGVGEGRGCAPIDALEIDKPGENFYSAPQHLRVWTTAGEVSHATAHQ